MTRILSIAVAALLLAGCAATAQGPRVDPRDQEIAQLRAEQTELRAELAVVRDSLRFLDEIDSGRYYDRMRSLTNRIDRLQYEVALLQDGGTPIATILADQLFEPGTATLSSRGTTELRSVAEALTGPHRTAAVRVEGHSDNVPVGGSLKEKYPSNWELSTARAAAVIRHLIEEHDLAADRFTAMGYGATRPVAPENTAEGRRQNRRIRVLVASPIGEPAPERTVQAAQRTTRG